MSVGIECLDQDATAVATVRAKGVKYTAIACTECNRSKVRCESARPCSRCTRLNLNCTDKRTLKYGRDPKNGNSNALHDKHLHRLRETEMAMEAKFVAYCESMQYHCPVEFADVFTTSQEQWFISTMVSMVSIAPRARVLDFNCRLHAISANSNGYVTPASGPVPTILNDATNAMIRATPHHNYLPSLTPLESLFLDNNSFLGYLFNIHKFGVFDRFHYSTPKGIKVASFFRNKYNGKLEVEYSLNPIAESIFGFTSSDYSKRYSNYDIEIGDVNKVPPSSVRFHNLDVFEYCARTLKAFIYPGYEVHGRVRTISSNGCIIQCTSSQLVVQYPDGSIRFIVTVLIPDADQTDAN